MNKILKTIYPTILTAIIIVGSLLPVNSVLADGNILVEIWNKDGGCTPYEEVCFENLAGNPIFDASNFLPGNTETERLRITNNNNSPESQTIGLSVTDFERGCVTIDGINYCLADRLILTITKIGSSSFSYSGSLTDFYAADKVSLSEVSGNGGNVEYDFSVYFEKDEDKGYIAANAYQDANTKFDLDIGFLKQATGGGGEVSNFITKKYPNEDSDGQDEDDANVGVVKGAEDEQIKPKGEEIGILPKVGPYFPWICLLALVIFGITLKIKRLIKF